MKYFAVEAKCGHVGKSRYILKTFGIAAKDAKEAAKLARKMPRVKHDHRDAVRSVTEIDYWTYDQILEDNLWDPYLSSTNIQEQRMSCGCDLETFDEEVEDVDDKEEKEHINWKMHSFEKRKKAMDKHFSMYLEYEAA